jgi:integrase
MKEVWSGIRRTVGVAQTAKAAATTDYLKQILQLIPSTIIGVRDRALLLVGFAAALRRSELVALQVEDIQFVPEGAVVHIRRSKTDQEARGESVAIALGKQPETCPVRALNTWFSTSGISTGPIFRGIDRWNHLQDTALTDKVVALQVFAGHSLRAGLATSAAIAGVNERKIMDQTRHKSVVMVRRYVREANLFRENASAAVGL